MKTDDAGRIRFDVDFTSRRIQVTDRPDLSSDLPAKGSTNTWLVWVYSKEFDAGSRRIEVWAPEAEEASLATVEEQDRG